MTRSENRIARLESRIGASQCGGPLCAKCVLAKFNSEHDGKPWRGCDGNPAGLTDLLKLTNRELAHFAGVSIDGTSDKELAAIAVGRAEGGER